MIKKVLLFLVLAIVIFSSVNYVYAEEAGAVVVSPAIIDRKVKSRDILEENVTIRNNTASRVFLYAVVSDISSDGQPQFATSSSAVRDRKNSVASWMEVTAGVTEIEPGKEATVPVRLDVYLDAAPGKHYGMVSFVNANDRYAAEDLAKNSKQPNLLLNIEVEDQVVERAQLDAFRVGRDIFFFRTADFFVSIKNIGNTDIIPKGDIHIYNRRGLEVATLPINEDQRVISNKNEFVYNGVWDKGVRLGRYKAKLIAEYGERTSRDLQDDIFFWVLPWQYLVLFSCLVLFLFILLIVILKRKTIITNFHHQPPVRKTEAGRKNNVINLKM